MYRSSKPLCIDDKPLVGARKFAQRQAFWERYYSRRHHKQEELTATARTQQTESRADICELVLLAGQFAGPSMKSFFAFLRSEPVVIGMKAGLLAAVLFLALHYLVGC
jgi:hypothetical protein